MLLVLTCALVAMAQIWVHIRFDQRRQVHNQARNRTIAADQAAATKADLIFNHLQFSQPGVFTPSMDAAMRQLNNGVPFEQIQTEDGPRPVYVDPQSGGR